MTNIEQLLLKCYLEGRRDGISHALSLLDMREDPPALAPALSQAQVNGRCHHETTPRATRSARHTSGPQPRTQ